MVCVTEEWVGTEVAFSLCILQTPGLTLPTYTMTPARGLSPPALDPNSWVGFGTSVYGVKMKNRVSSLIRPPWDNVGSRQKGLISKDVGQ